MRLLPLAVLALLVSVFAVPAAAIPPPASLSPSTVAGLVTDETGGVVPGAAVVLRAADRTLQTFTDAEGRFAFEQVPPGPVAISVAISGFATATLDLPHARPALRLVLRPGAVSERVTVRPDGLAAVPVSPATRTATPLRDVPQAVTVITHEAMAEQGMQNLADVVRYLPGITMAQGEGNRDAAVFRGNQSTADFFVDGVRDDVQYFRDLYNVERVEALQGPNAMMFGRGGAGGVINRVTRQANFAPVREATLQAGGYGNRRMTLDLGHALTRRLAARVTGMYENSGSYRQDVRLERYGVNPTLALTLGPGTLLTAGFERFHDERTADRGIPSFRGRPIEAHPSTFFGDPDASRSHVTVNAVHAAVEHKVGQTGMLRNRLRLAGHDKFYQNVYPGAVNAAGSAVSLSAYNHAATRTNLCNQTDFTVAIGTGRIRHTWLAGSEFSRQVTSNLRRTGYFTALGREVTTAVVTTAAPTVSLPVEYRAAAGDADNRSTATVAAIYVQDQVEFTPRLQAIAGLRYDTLEVSLHNNRAGTRLRSRDRLLAPRVGLVYKPAVRLSLYTSYSLAYVPRAGEQLSSLTPTNQALDPERFRNYEVGGKWDIRPHLSLSVAVYRLDRTNVAVPDPLNPARSLLVDAQRTRGVEAGLSGRVTRAWSLACAYAYQRGEITRSVSSTAQAGARLAQVPEHTLSVWNRYDFTTRLGAGLGVIRRAEMFTSTDNLVMLPAFTRVDAAGFVTLSARLRAQLHVENLLDRRYYASAHSNNNITPGSPRALRLALTASF